MASALSLRQGAFWTALSTLIAFGSAMPIRVLIFTPCGPSGYIASTRPKGQAIARMLRDPSGARLNLAPGDIPSGGFQVDSVTAPDGTMPAGTAQGDSLVARLRETDVVVAVDNTDIGSLFTPSARAAFLRRLREGGFGLAATINTTDNFRDPWWTDSVVGARFTSHTSAKAVIHADSISMRSGDADFANLNAGLDSTYLINNVWFSYLDNPRSRTGLHVLSTVDERTYSPDARMGDHPVSWYWVPYGSGRVYYNGMGWTTADYENSYALRRQLYNGILWAARWSGSGSLHAKEDATAWKPRISVSRGSFTITLAREGRHRLEILGLNGKRKALREGSGACSYVFRELRADGIYLAVVSSENGRSSTLIKAW